MGTLTTMLTKETMDDGPTKSGSILGLANDVPTVPLA